MVLRPRSPFRLPMILGVAVAAGACAPGSSAPVAAPDVPKARLDTIRRAQVWLRTTVAGQNLKIGPQSPGAFPPQATVTCDYVDKKLEGGTPKFACAVAPGDEL